MLGGGAAGKPTTPVFTRTRSRSGMSVIPVFTARQIVSLLLKAGFKILRQKGSHIRLQHPVTKRATTVAMHVGTLSRDLAAKIIKQAGISLSELLRLLGKK
jgi:predicted RNA binding protein YcfA (HicA-like mRNA interferase family)